MRGGNFAGAVGVPDPFREPCKLHLKQVSSPAATTQRLGSLDCVWCAANSARKRWREAMSRKAKCKPSE